MSPETSAFERHYRIAELAELWGIGRETVRLLVKDEPGVVKIRMPAPHIPFWLLLRPSQGYQKCRGALHAVARTDELGLSDRGSEHPYINSSRRLVDRPPGALLTGVAQQRVRKARLK